MVGAGSAAAATPAHEAGAPFVTFALAQAQGDYALACEQFADAALLRGITPRPRSVAAARRICVDELRSADAHLDEHERSVLGSTRVVRVRVTPGRARVTIATTLYGIEPQSTGTAVIDDGIWKIWKVPSGAHVGRSLVHRIPSEGMLPTLNIGDAILVDQDAYRSTRPQISDIVVFHPPLGADTGTCAKRPPKRQACAKASARNSRAKFVSRIVGRPGDRISIRNGRVTRNGQRARETFIKRCGTGGDGCDLPRTIIVPAGRYYVLGDNRGAADDSRYWGPIDAQAIVGRVQRLGP